MDFEMSEEDRMLKDLVRRFVDRELMPLHLMASKIRTMRIYDGPTEIHNWVVARNLSGAKW